MPKIPVQPLIRSAVSAGLSGNAAYRQMLAAAREQSELTGERWTGIQRSTFLQIYSQTVSMRAKVPDALTAPKDVIPGEHQIVDRTTVRARGYGNWAVVFSRQIGGSAVEMEFYLQRTDVPLTPEQLEQMAQADFEASTQQLHGTKRGYMFLGASYTGTERMTPAET